MRGVKRRIFVLQGLAAQGFASIGVTRAAVGVVPRGVAAVANFLGRLVPGPAFQQRMHPQVQVECGDVGPDVADLLLPGAPHFLDVVKVLFDRRAVGERLDDLARRGVGIGAEEVLAAVGSLTITTRISPSAGRYVARKVLIVLVTRCP